MTRGRSQSVVSVMYKPTGELCRKVIKRVISAISVKLAASLGVESRGLVTRQLVGEESETVYLAPLTVRERPVEVAGNRWHIQSLVIVDVQMEVPWNTIWSGGTVVTVPRVTGQLSLPDYRSPLTPDGQALVISLREVAEDPSTPLAMSATLQALVRLVEEQLHQTTWVMESCLVYLSNRGMGENMVFRGTGLQYYQSRCQVRSLQLTSTGEMMTIHDLDYNTSHGYPEVEASVIRVQPSRVVDLPQFKAGRLTRLGLSKTSLQGRVRLELLQVGELTVRGIRVSLDAMPTSTCTNAHTGATEVRAWWTTASVHGAFELYLPTHDSHPTLHIRRVDEVYHLRLQPLRLRLVSLPALRAWGEEMWGCWQTLQERWIRHHTESDCSGQLDNLDLRLWYGDLQAAVRVREITTPVTIIGLTAHLTGQVSLMISVDRITGEMGSQSASLRGLRLDEGPETQSPQPAQLTIDHLDCRPERVEIRGGHGTCVGRLLRRLGAIGSLVAGGRQSSGPTPAISVRELSLTRQLGGLTLVTQVREMDLSRTGRGRSVSTVTLGGRSLGTWAVTWRKR